MLVELSFFVRHTGVVIITCSHTLNWYISTHKHAHRHEYTYNTGIVGVWVVRRYNCGNVHFTDRCNHVRLKFSGAGRQRFYVPYYIIHAPSTHTTCYNNYVRLLHIIPPRCELWSFRQRRRAEARHRFTLSNWITIIVIAIELCNFSFFFFLYYVLVYKLQLLMNSDELKIQKLLLLSRKLR